MSFGPWLSDRYWNIVLDHEQPFLEFHPLWLSPGEDSDRFARFVRGDLSTNDVAASFDYSNSFVATPSAWPSGPGATEARLRPARPDDVRWPSSKVLMFDRVRAYLNGAAGARPLLRADHSAELRHDRDATEPVANTLRPGHEPRRYRDTPGGVHGRDV